LLLQFVASFGHLHPEDYRFLLQGHGALVLVAGDPTSRGTPPLLADIDCPICTATQLLGNSTLPDPVALLPRSMAPIATLIAAEELRLVARDHLLRPTRGPPLA